MNATQKDKLIKGTKSITKEDNFMQLFRECLPLFYLSVRRCVFLFFVGLFICVLLYYFLFQDVMAINLFKELIADVNEIIIPTFAVLITGYAIFQALASGPTLVVLIMVDNADEKTKFEKYNLYFLGIAILYLFIIILNLNYS